MQFLSNEMKKGDIVRLISKSGLAMGRYYIVSKTVGKRLYVTNSIAIKPFMLPSQSNVKVYSKMRIQVSAADYKKLNKPYTSTYYHEVSPQYDKLYDAQPEIIEFYCTGIQRRIFWKTDVIHRKVIDGKPCIRIYFSERLFRPLFD